MAQELRQQEITGIQWTPITFTPTRQKWAGKECQGLKLTITNRQDFRPYQFGLHLVTTLYRLYNDKGFQWRQEPYEFVVDVPAIDLLTGSDQFRKELEATL